MDAMDESLDFVFERALSTKGLMFRLLQPPSNWSWRGLSPNNFSDQLRGLDDQLVRLKEFEAGTTGAGALWDQDLDLLLADSSLGTRLARVEFQNDRFKSSLFASLRNNGTSRVARYEQALDFEVAWKKADAQWVFKSGLTLADFTLRRKAIRTREEAHDIAERDERNERLLLHSQADDLNAVCVDWYEVATATFAEHTVPGQLVRSIPTTYDPNRPPGRLEFVAHMSVAPNQVHLKWRAPRGEKHFIFGKGPGASEPTLMLDGVTDREWVGLGLSAGLWEFQGYARNQFGQGPASDAVQVTIAAALAA